MASKKSEKFSKKAILKNAITKDKKLLEALLKDDEVYSSEEASKILATWRKGDVKK